MYEQKQHKQFFSNANSSVGPLTPGGE